MQTANLTHNRLGALALGLSALLFFASLLYVPVDPSYAPIGLLWQTGWLFILGLTVFPLGMLALYACLARQRAGRLALTALICQLIAVGPLQVFAGLDTFGLSTLRHFIFQAGGDAARQQLLQTMMAEVVTKLSPLPFPWTGVGIYSLLVVSLIVLDIGMLLLAVAVWRSGGLSKWASALYALGFVLYLGAVFASQGNLLRVADAAIGATGGVWLAWSLWQQKPTGAA